jgi:hypothetical protein
MSCIINFDLFRAVELNNQEMVSMILDSQYGREAFQFTDTSERTVLHHGSKHPKLLKYLLETAEQLFDKVNTGFLANWVTRTRKIHGKKP